MRWSLIKLALLAALEIATWRYMDNPGQAFFLFWACVGVVLTILSGLSGMKSQVQFHRESEESMLRQDLLPHRGAASVKRTLPPCVFYVVLNLALYLLV